MKNNEVNPTWQTKSMTVKEAFIKALGANVGFFFFFNFKSCIDSTPEHFLYLVMGEKNSLSLSCYERFRGHSAQ